jgi:hypothetical protein
VGDENSSGNGGGQGNVEGRANGASLSVERRLLTNVALGYSAIAAHLHEIARNIDRIEGDQWAASVYALIAQLRELRSTDAETIDELTRIAKERT